MVPKDLEAERAVLGSVLLDDRAISLARVILTDPEAFFLPRHRLIWSAMLAIDSARGALDAVGVLGYLTDHGDQDRAGGGVELISLTEAVVTAQHVEAHARRVAACFVRRRLLAAAAAVMEAARTAETAEEACETAQMAVHAAVERSSDIQVVALGELVRASARRLIEAHESGDALPAGLPTGYGQLDELTAGLHRGELTVIGARPGMGKTALAKGIALNVARGGAPALVFSAEMTREQMGDRALAAEARIGLQAMRQRRVPDDAWGRVSAVAGRWDLPVKVVCHPRPRLWQIRSIARAQAHAHGIKLIVVDYLQLVTVPPERGRRREEEVAMVAAGLKGLALELNVPVLALAQLNRSLESRPNKRPVLSDLRESGAVEQDADVVMFLYRPGYYDKRAPDDVAEIEVAKQRQGPPGTATVKFLAEFTAFLSESSAQTSFDLPPARVWNQGEVVAAAGGMVSEEGPLTLAEINGRLLARGMADHQIDDRRLGELLALRGWLISQNGMVSPPPPPPPPPSPAP